MTVSVPNTSRVRTENDLIVLYKHFASLYKDEPKKQLECFTKLIGNEHETPRVFTTLINLLGKILDKNVRLMDSVIGVLVAAMQTKHMNVENCDYILETLNAKKKELRGFTSANLSVFIKQVTAYKNAMQTIENIIENPIPNPTLATLYGISRPSANTKYGVTNPGPTPMYGVSRPCTNTKYGVVKPKPQAAYSTKYGVSAKCLKDKYYD